MKIGLLCLWYLKRYFTNDVMNNFKELKDFMLSTDNITDLAEINIRLFLDIMY